MKKKYTKYFGVSLDELEKREVFNGYVDRDSQYYIVPYKLENLEIPEFKNSYEKFKEYFGQVVKLMDEAKNMSETDFFYKNAIKKFAFREIGHIGLGYSEGGKSGSGVGKKLSEKITKTAYELVKAGIKDPEFFQMIGLLEEGVGADRISDMTLSILKDDFYNYTQRVAQELRLKTTEVESYLLPLGEDGKPIIFCPTSILTKLPISIDANDIEEVCSHNETLRSEVNRILSGVFDESAKKLKKDQIKQVFLNKPELANRLFKKCKEKNTTYDFIGDPDGDMIWEKIAEQIVSDYSLNLSENCSVEEVVNKICNQYQDVIENKGLWREFHNDNGTHKKESFAQGLFYAMALGYCEANNLDISPESNAGNGAVDFKISQGAEQKILVEMKLSSHTSLVPSYMPQTEAYMKAESALLIKYVVVQIDKRHDFKIKKLIKEKNKQTGMGKKAPEVIIIDATKKESASQR